MNYQTGQSVIYRNKGVYTIESIGKVAFLPDSEKIYYTLRPVFRSAMNISMCRLIKKTCCVIPFPPRKQANI